MSSFTLVLLFRSREAGKFAENAKRKLPHRAPYRRSLSASAAAFVAVAGVREPPSQPAFVYVIAFTVSPAN